MEHIDGDDAYFDPLTESTGRGMSPDEEGDKSGRLEGGSAQPQDRVKPLATSAREDVENAPKKENNEDVIEAIKFEDMSKEAEANQVKKKVKRADGQGDFCVIDRRIISHVAENAPSQIELPALCCLAICSDATNSLTRAGVNCLRNYLGVSRHAAATAIESLERMGVLERLELKEVRDPTKSRFRIRSIEEILGEPIPAIPDPDAGVFLPNLLARTAIGRSPLARLLATGLLGSIATLLQLYVELDFKSFSGISPKILTSAIEKSEPLKIGNYQITTLSKPPILDGTMPMMEHLGQEFRRLKDNPAVLENLRWEGLLSWVVWTGQGAQVSSFVGFPLAAFGANGADLGATETSVGLAHHLLAGLISGSGAGWCRLADVQVSFLNAPALSHVVFGVSADLKVAATVKLRYSPASVRGLAAEHVLRKQCRDLVHDVAALVERDFSSASGLARELVQAYERKG